MKLTVCDICKCELDQEIDFKFTGRTDGSEKLNMVVAYNTPIVFSEGHLCKEHYNSIYEYMEKLKKEKSK